MSRRAQSMPPMLLEKPKRRPIVAIICFSWKIFTCVFSHVALVSIVVAYCIAGALLFEHLEADNEKTVKQGIRGMRTNVTDDLWDMTTTFDYLHQDNWTRWVEYRLERFEREILTAMKTKGWDGNENEQQMQWTFFGALFYSIVVITTIGYGHIAPKTDMGKVITIFYAILGIPLMLLCLSNIGDVMAGSFRFLYWRVCCFVCTREPRRSRRSRQNRMSARAPTRARSQPPPNIRRSIRVSQRSADSGFITRSEYEQNLAHSFSDPQLRYNTGGSGRQSDRRPRDDFQYDMFNERGRDNRRSPRRTTNRDCEDDLYNERRGRRGDRDDRYPDRPSRRYNDDRNDDRNRDRRMQRDRSPNYDCDDCDPDDDRDVGRNRNRYTGRGDRYADRDRDYGRDRDYDCDRDRDYDCDRDDDRDDDRDRDRSNRYRRRSDHDRTIEDEDFHNNSSRNPRASDRSQRFSNREQNRERLRDRHTVERERNIKRPNRLDPLADLDESPSPRRSQSVRSLRPSPSNNNRGANRDNDRDRNCDRNLATGENRPAGNSGSSKRSPKTRARSVDPRTTTTRYSVEPDEYGVVENRYARLEDNPNNKNGRRKASRSGGPNSHNRSYSLPRPRTNNKDRLEVPATPVVAGNRRSRERDDFDDEFDDGLRMFSGRGDDDRVYTQPTAIVPRRERPELKVLPPSPRIMSPMGFAIHRQAKFTKSFDDDYDVYFDDDWSSFTDTQTRNRPVPIWLCVFLVVGYIIAGAFLFSEWEHWSFLDSAYFCFITLTTIGFGDFVPAQGVKQNSEISIALCSLYLLFGISLLAMSFNLVQEEVISNVKSVARRLGIIKEKEIEE